MGKLVQTQQKAIDSKGDAQVDAVLMKAKTNLLDKPRSKGFLK